MSQQSRYILSKRIARGGMAEIYLGKALGEDDFQRICAIKRILPHYSQDQEFIEMFRSEASICKRLQHANIVQVYDFKEVEGSYAIIMEFVDGIDLRSALAACEKARTRLTVPMIIYIVAAAARGLHYAHTKIDPVTRKPLEIVHRDISPQNLIVSYEGEVKVIDFGIAKFESNVMETKPGVVKGKYSYMSPEQVTAKNLDARTDVFSLSIVLWEALAMKRLFAGESEVETIKNVQSAMIAKSLPELNQDVDNDLMKIIYKGLAKDRGKRYQSAASFEKDLMRYLNVRYPDFNASQLGNFLKQLLAKERSETQDNIKTLLSSTSLKAAPPASAPPETLSDGIESEKYSGSYRSGVHDLKEIVAKSSKGLDLKLDDNDLATSHQLMGIGRRHAAPAQTQNRGQQPASKASPFASLQRSPNPVMQTPLSSGTRFNSPQRQTNNMMMIAAVSLMLIVLGVGTVVVRGLLKPTPTKATVWLTKVAPKKVRILVNNKPLFSNRYVDTPIDKPIRMSPGRYVFTFARDGYKSKSYQIKASAGKTIQLPAVSLARDPTFVPAKLRIRSRAKLWVDIDRGFYEGYAPVEVANLRHKGKHEIVVSPNSNQKKDRIRCRFVISSPNPSRPYVVKVEVDKSGKPLRCKAQRN